MMLILIIGFYFEIPEDPLFHWYIRKASGRKKKLLQQFSYGCTDNVDNV